ncbi:MAG: ATP-binding protein, partial [Methanosarcinales archaeon]
MTKKKIFAIVPEEEFVNREELLDRLYCDAMDTARQASDNIVLLGRRRVGKSAVLTRVYDKLFFEQDLVVPIYFTYEGLPSNLGEYIAEEYFKNFVSQYIAFKKKDIKLRKKATDLNLALKLAQELEDIGLMEIIEAYIDAKQKQYFQGIVHNSIGAPRMVAEENESAICVIIDEFQEILKIVDRDGRILNFKGLYQFAVESALATHIISGSAVTIMRQEILRRGPLLGRFEPYKISGLSTEYAIELQDRLSKMYGFEMPYEQKVYIANYTSGLPFYIKKILLEIKRYKVPIVTEEVLCKAISHEITRGGIYDTLEMLLLQYAKQNKLNITRSVLYHCANFEDKKINPDEIAEKLQVSSIEVMEALSQMSRADLIEPSGGFYYNIPDPVMRKFLRTQYFREVMGVPQADIEEEEKNKIYTQLSDEPTMIGLLVESHLTLLMMYWDNRVVSGNLFGLDKSQKITLPKFHRVFNTKVKPPRSREYQIDLIGTYFDAGKYLAWIGESKYRNRPINKSDITKFNRACIAAQKSYGFNEITKWFFSATGFSEPAIEEAKKHNILLTDLKNVNQLLS